MSGAAHRLAARVSEMVRPVVKRHRQRRDERTAGNGIRAKLAGPVTAVRAGCRRVAQRSLLAAAPYSRDRFLSRR